MFNTKPFETVTAFGSANNTFGAKPATGNVFGTCSACGTAAPADGGLFGSTNLIGQTSTAFGQPAATSMFGGTSTSDLFGTTTQSSGLFGGSSSSAFGSPHPTFGGFGTLTPGTNLFGQNATAGSNLFGGTSTGFGATTVGTTIMFNPPLYRDTMLRLEDGTSQNINVRQQCITCMKEYENKSLEELRLEDYQANRKGPQAGVSGFGATLQQPFGGFGVPAASSSGFSFGTYPATTTTDGTTIEFSPTLDSDTKLKGEMLQNVNVRQRCITCMKEYESKSLEELRLDNYHVNQKGPQAGFSGFGATLRHLFGRFDVPAASSYGLPFGTAPATTGFEAPTVGTTIKFSPTLDSDTMLKGEMLQNVNVRQHCITCMKEYENKSLEELRLEDYQANRKGPQVGVSGFGATSQQPFGGFGVPAASSSGFSFGCTPATTGFEATAVGTTIKFSPTLDSDTMLRGEMLQNVNVRQQCITCMKEYENKSLEELRLEDYQANRKGPQPGVSGFGATPQHPGGLFGTPAASSSSGFPFGTAPATTGFGATTTGTSIKLNLPVGNDTMVISVTSQNMDICHRCSMHMKEYENKSLEELRLEDYQANRKGPRACVCGFGATLRQPGGLFGASAESSSGFPFGTTQTKSLFETTPATKNLEPYKLFKLMFLAGMIEESFNFLSSIELCHATHRAIAQYRQNLLSLARNPESSILFDSGSPKNGQNITEMMRGYAGISEIRCPETALQYLYYLLRNINSVDSGTNMFQRLACELLLQNRQILSVLPEVMNTVRQCSHLECQNTPAIETSKSEQKGDENEKYKHNLEDEANALKILLNFKENSPFQ